VPRVRYKSLRTSGPAVAAVAVGDVGLDRLGRPAWPIQEGDHAPDDGVLVASFVDRQLASPIAPVGEQTGMSDLVGLSDQDRAAARASTSPCPKNDVRPFRP
jgi:hypothetical protein